MTPEPDETSTRLVGTASGLAAPDSRGATSVTSLLRRCAKIGAITVDRSARVACHSATRRLRRQEIDQAGSLAGQLRLALEDLGPTFVKLGQLLSARSDIASPHLQEELSKLRDHAPTIPQAELIAELERGLGEHLSGLFATFELAPVASGSIAQVHRATLHNGLCVAVKVRRPGVRADIDADVSLLRQFSRLVARLSSRIRAYDPVAIIDEFAAVLRAETDFITEARNLEAVARVFADHDTVVIPRVLTEMNGESILVMDWIEGIPLSDRKRLEEVGASQATLARAILQAFGTMIFLSDRFHADPHPGNLIAMDGGRLGLIDFGEVGSVNPAERTALLGMMTAVLGTDGPALADAVLSVSRITHAVDRSEFGSQLAVLLEAVTDASLKDVRLGKALGELLHLLRRYGIVLPSDLAILIKTMIECEGTTYELDPTISMLHVIREVGSFAQAPRKTPPAPSLHDK